MILFWAGTPLCTTCYPIPATRPLQHSTWMVTDSNGVPWSLHITHLPLPALGLLWRGGERQPCNLLAICTHHWNRRQADDQRTTLHQWKRKADGKICFSSVLQVFSSKTHFLRLLRRPQWDEHQTLTAVVSSWAHTPMAVPSNAISLPQGPPCPNKLPVYICLCLRLCFQGNSGITHTQED